MLHTQLSKALSSCSAVQLHAPPGGLGSQATCCASLLPLLGILCLVHAACGAEQEACPF